MSSQNLRISELPNALSMQMDDFIPIARKLGDSDKRATKKLLIEDLLNGIKNEIDFSDIIEEYITVNINKFNGLVKEAYLGTEKLTITQDGKLLIPDKSIELQQQINLLAQNVLTLNNMVEELNERVTKNEGDIVNLKNYVDNEYYNKIVDLINSMINKSLGYLETDVIFLNNVSNQDIYIKDEGLYTIVQSKKTLPNDINSQVGTSLPSKNPGTYLIYDLTHELFTSLLKKYSDSTLYELTNNGTEGIYYFPVHANIFFNNETKKLIYFFQECYSFEGLLFIK